MDDGKERCPVFCITDIPTSALDLLLQCTEEYLEEYRIPDYKLHTPDRIVIMDTKDVSSISRGSSVPVSLSPAAFVGMTVQEIRDWFDTNITQTGREGFMHHCFLVLDAQSVTDESCLFVCTQDAPLQSLRCDFDVALQNAVVCNDGQSIEEGAMGSFMRSEMIMTKANLKLAMNGGVYMEGGEVKVDQAWKDFLNW
ncbi:hypothetical protein BDZ94DRAFT_1254306 [Collybia nuda]|uniref:Uncharacterized protein n=1 Tax=Collybia nuda TaxID=64659 RepID=A0A9P5YAU5_9AGAR|nr:hypothetical protein BDZ94DRAFT_1254306 [Collybia nuda]